MKNLTLKIVRRVARSFGFMLIPIQEVRKMEGDAAGYYKAMQRPRMEDRDRGYFNGLADGLSKTSLHLRKNYLTKKHEHTHTSQAGP